MKRQLCLIFFSSFVACGEAPQEDVQWTLKDPAQIWVSHNDVSFFNTPMNMPRTEVLTIQNKGQVGLNITEIELVEGREDADAEFELQLLGSTDSVYLDAGKSMPIAVVYRPVNVFYDTAQLRIKSSDSAQPLTIVNLTGSVEFQRPDLSAPRDVSFQATFKGQASSKLTMIRNLGDAPLLVHDIQSSDRRLFEVTYPNAISPNDPALDRAIHQRTIPPGEDMWIRLWFKPRRVGLHEGAVTVETSDGEFPFWVIRLQGQGLDPDEWGVVSSGSSQNFQSP